MPELPEREPYHENENSVDNIKLNKILEKSSNGISDD